MRDDIPLTHAEEAQGLEAAGFASLLTVQFTAAAAGGLILRLSATKQVTWQGMTFEGVPFSLAGIGSNSSGEVSRPKLTLPNAAGAFSTYAHQGWLNNALVTRQLVRKADLDGNVNSFSQKKWRVAKIANLSKRLIILELRGIFDGQSFKLPPRAYYPPDFPSVSLG
jgi:phage-related protein